MTREEKLYTMTGTVLIQLADKLGVKVACNRTRSALKEAKSKVIERILKAESVTQQSVVEVKEEKVEVPVVVAVEEKPVKKESAKEVRNTEAPMTCPAATKLVQLLNTTPGVTEVREWIKNSWAVKMNGKPFMEIRLTKFKGYTLYLRESAAIDCGLDYKKIQNYYLPATIKQVDLTTIKNILSKGGN